jgi:hypothetical protein
MRAAIVALAIGATVVLAALGPLGLRLLGPDPGTVDPVIQMGRDWEIMRRQQSGWIEPAFRVGWEWEKQRKQQSPFYD